MSLAAPSPHAGEDPPAPDSAKDSSRAVAAAGVTTADFPPQVGTSSPPIPAAALRPEIVSGDVVAEPWTIEQSVATYNVDRWGLGYFDINAAGNVCVNPTRAPGGTSIDIMEVLHEARDQSLHFPMVIRFQDLLRDRVHALNNAFRSAIDECKFTGRYMGVFPIKVNQLREVVEEITDAGREYDYGLEAGSKPELFAALAIHDNKNSLIVCNGYKDTAFIRMALHGIRLGRKVIMVAEKMEEVRAIVDVAREMNVEPMIGIRIRLHARANSGMWATSGGENAKFGLSTMDLMSAVTLLQDEGMLHTLRLVHFHIGSQVPDILSIKKAVREATRYYAKLRKAGCTGIDWIDLGGGLGVDYDGSKTNFASSANYSMEEYALDAVYNVMDVCDEEQVPHPNIVSESGRAIVAHHSLLVVQVFGAIEKTKAQYDLTVAPDDHRWIRQIAEIKERVARNPTDALHDVQQIKSDAQAAFDLGILDLRTKAKIETFYWHIIEEIIDHFHRRAAATGGKEEVPEEVADLTSHAADQYLCNFSVFQSLLDHWALGQLFPIMPLHRLHEGPTIQGTLVDITCDSDGKVSKFTDLKDVRSALPLHPLREQEPYYLGIFMTGAYQDIMGDLHNLFGRVNEAHVFLDDDEESGWYIEETIAGHNVSHVLELVQYHQTELVRRMKAQVDEAIKSDSLKPTEGMRLLAEYERGLQMPTYLTLDK